MLCKAEDYCSVLQSVAAVTYHCSFLKDCESTESGGEVIIYTHGQT